MMAFFRKPKPAERVYPAGSISTGNARIRDRIQFYGLTEEDLGVIAFWKPVAVAAMDRLIEEFYQHILGNSTTRAIIERHTSVDRQRPLVTRYLLTMFEGRIDDQYLAYRNKVGQVHDRIDLDSTWYVAMYEVVRKVLTAEIANHGATAAEVQRFSEAFGRLTQLDIGLVVTALTDSRRGTIEGLQQEAKAFLDETAVVVEALGNRDLSVRLNGQYEGRYAEMKETLNRAVEDLSDTLFNLSTAVGEVRGASEQIRAGSQNLANQTNDQASSLEKISTSLQQMSSMTAQNVESTREGNQLAETAQAETEQGVERMERLAAAIERIKKSSDETGKIVKTIDEIAFQTNLLALNAAVEAARAGEAGKGFAVVAEEVRSLAIRSAEAAKSTSEMIRQAVRSAGDGVNLGEEVVASLNAISERISRVRQVMSEISGSSEQQAQGIRQVNDSVETLNGMTQTAAAASEQSAAATEELTSQAAAMEELVEQFTLDEDGRRRNHEWVASHSTQEIIRFRGINRIKGDRGHGRDPFLDGEF